MIISDFGGQISIFSSKYAYFAKNVTFDPLGVLMYEFTPKSDGIFSKNY